MQNIAILKLKSPSELFKKNAKYLRQSFGGLARLYTYLYG